MQPEDTVYFVDVAPQPYEQLINICGKVEKVIILDHHRSLLDFLDDHIFSLPDNLVVHGNPKIAACEITWEFFSPGTVPLTTVRLLGQYDSWRNTKEKQIEGDLDWNTALAFQFGMRLFKLDVDFMYEQLFIKPTTLITDIIKQGETILKYQEQQDTSAMNYSFSVTLNGLHCLCLCTGARNSNTFKSLWDPDKWDVMLAFSFTGKRWSYSAYSTKPEIDCSELAKFYGGGGHKGAAGFYSDKCLVVVT
jgi:nanoRNase/pAp phosphatase (c-di-AMP/oligoRNAs hydrolase)